MNRHLRLVPVILLFLAGCNVGSSVPSEPTNPNNDSNLNPTVDGNGLERIDCAGLAEQIASWPAQRRPSPDGKWSVGQPPSTLRELHAFAVHRFIISPGFGVERLPALHESPGQSWAAIFGALHFEDR